MSTIPGNGGDTINISYNLGQLYYNINGGIDILILAWPVTIINNTPGSGILKVLFTTDITLNNINYFFICGSPNIQFGDTSLKPDGTRPIITIDNVVNYPGLVQNGAARPVIGKDNIYIFNLYVASNNSSISIQGGWIGQAYFGQGTSPVDLLTNNYIICCSSDGDINGGGGGRDDEDDKLLLKLVLSNYAQNYNLLKMRKRP